MSRRALNKSVSVYLAFMCPHHRPIKHRIMKLSQAETRSRTQIHTIRISPMMPNPRFADRYAIDQLVQYYLCGTKDALQLGMYCTTTPKSARQGNLSAAWTKRQPKNISHTADFGVRRLLTAEMVIQLIQTYGLDQYSFTTDQLGCQAWK